MRGGGGAEREESDATPCAYISKKIENKEEGGKSTLVFNNKSVSKLNVYLVS